MQLNVCTNIAYVYTQIVTSLPYTIIILTFSYIQILNWNSNVYHYKGKTLNLIVLYNILDIMSILQKRFNPWLNYWKNTSSLAIDLESKIMNGMFHCSELATIAYRIALFLAQWTIKAEKGQLRNILQLMVY